MDITRLKNYSISNGPWFLEKLFINMKVISKVKKGQKLYVKDDILSIENGDIRFLGSFMRWWYTESRDLSLKKIQSIIKESIECGINAIESEQMNKFFKEDDFDINNMNKKDFDKITIIKNWESVREDILHMDNINLLKKLISEMDGMIKGIEELQGTYEMDVTFCSKLDLEIELIKRAKTDFESYLNGSKV